MVMHSFRWKFLVLWALFFGWFGGAMLGVMFQSEGCLYFATLAFIASFFWFRRTWADYRIYRHELIREQARQDARRSVRMRVAL